MKGLFIMVEGTDGSGKTVQTELLSKRIKKSGRRVELISFPQYGKRSAALVEDYLHGEFGRAEEVGPYRASLFYACDRYAASHQIKEWIQKGTIVIANRYTASNLGHQGGKIKNKKERKHYYEWLYHLEYDIFKIPKPDINIILHVKPEISQLLVDKKEARAYLKGKKRDIHEDDFKHLKNAERAYLEIAKLFPEFKLIECVKSGKLLPVEEIQQRIWDYLRPHIRQK